MGNRVKSGKFFVLCHDMKSLLLLLCWCISVAVFSQKVAVTPQEVIALEAERFLGVDDYNSLYYIKGNTLFKKDDRQLYQFAALQLGPIATVDLINPLKITLYYKDANTVLILDNTLSEIKRLSFTNIENFRNVSHTTTANDRRFWIFNTDTQQLEVFDYNTKKVIQQSLPIEKVPLSVASNFNFVWLLMDTQILALNTYGSFLHSLEHQGILSLRQHNGNLLGWDGQQFFYKPATQAAFLPVDLPKIPVKQFSLNNEILYIYDGQKVTSFRLKPAKN